MESPVHTALLATQDPAAIQHALSVLENGGLVAFPTDTVYGLGALAFDGSAVERIYAAKDRPDEKAIPILLGNTDHLARAAARVPAMARTLAERFWPGPLTLVVPKHPHLPAVVSAAATVGVRMPDHPFALDLLEKTGPLAVTSANLSGQTSPSTAEEVLVQLAGRIHLVLDGGRTPGGTPSTVVDCSGERPVMLRPGPISLDQIYEALA
jgi:L-threonylcarbamoyladenylate synthase